MNRTIGRVRLLFLALFSVGAVAIGYYQLNYARPAKVCEAKGRWWDAKSRACGIPVFIPDFTGRPPPAGVKRPQSPARADGR